MTTSASLLRGGFAVIAGSILALGAAVSGEKGKSPVRVKVETDKEERFDAEVPLDPTPRLNVRGLGATFQLNVMDETNRRLHLSHFPTIKIDGAASIPGTMGGRFEVMNGALPKKGTKPRTGYMHVWVNGDLRVTQTVELTPAKGFGEKRQRMEAALVRYTVENKGMAAHTVGMRTCIDSFLITARNCQFAAPTMPGKLLDGIELKGRDLPPYVQALQMPDLKNPGLVGYTTFNLGAGLEKPDRVLLTSVLGRRDVWDIAVMAGGGNSMLAFFWDPKELKPGAKREYAYAFGTGLATSLAPDSNFKIDLGGSFELGKTFTISAVITDPGEGQSLELELPKGLERVEGKLIQPVPINLGEAPESMVLWKGRVTEYGRFPIRIKSSAGVTKTTILTVEPG